MLRCNFDGWSDVIGDVPRCLSMQTRVCREAELESDPLWHVQPVQFVVQECRQTTSSSNHIIMSIIHCDCLCVTDTASSSAEAGHHCAAGQRLVKSTAFELFDEDANTESPTVSQKSNRDNIGLSHSNHVYFVNTFCCMGCYFGLVFILIFCSVSPSPHVGPGV